MKSFNLGKLIFCLLIPAIFGGISGLFNQNSVELYEKLVLPNFAPPSFVFPLVWTFLYTFMGIGFYLILQKRKHKLAVISFFVQLIANFTWPFVFFKFNLIVLGFYLHMFLLLTVIWMTFNFFKLNKFSGILQLPYIIWLSFAGYLNYYIVLLNA
ncbi:TspO/MBR family protein [Fusobacterium sp. MFO224]|uniref:TspO/MBR family protein n=1 Tax=Fusobacterium sp. MFO224 TaxID=3378070 RepID=UPI0038528317